MRKRGVLLIISYLGLQCFVSCTRGSRGPDRCEELVGEDPTLRNQAMRGYFPTNILHMDISHKLVSGQVKAVLFKFGRFGRRTTEWQKGYFLIWRPTGRSYDNLYANLIYKHYFEFGPKGGPSTLRLDDVSVRDGDLFGWESIRKTFCSISYDDSDDSTILHKRVPWAAVNGTNYSFFRYDVHKKDLSIEVIVRPDDCDERGKSTLSTTTSSSTATSFPTFIPKTQSSHTSDPRLPRKTSVVTEPDTRSSTSVGSVPSPSIPNPLPRSSKSRPSLLLYVGIAIGCVILITMLVLAIFLLRRRKRKAREKAPNLQNFYQDLDPNLQGGRSYESLVKTKHGNSKKERGITNLYDFKQDGQKTSGSDISEDSFNIDKANNPCATMNSYIDLDACGNWKYASAGQMRNNKYNEPDKHEIYVPVYLEICDECFTFKDNDVYESSDNLEGYLVNRCNTGKCKQCSLKHEYLHANSQKQEVKPCLRCSVMNAYSYIKDAPSADYLHAPTSGVKRSDYQFAMCVCPRCKAVSENQNSGKKRYIIDKGRSPRPLLKRANNDGQKKDYLVTVLGGYLKLKEEKHDHTYDTLRENGESSYESLPDDQVRQTQRGKTPSGGNLKSEDISSKHQNTLPGSEQIANPESDVLKMQDAAKVRDAASYLELVH